MTRIFPGGPQQPTIRSTGDRRTVCRCHISSLDPSSFSLENPRPKDQSEHQSLHRCIPWSFCKTSTEDNGLPLRGFTAPTAPTSHHTTTDTVSSKSAGTSSETASIFGSSLGADSASTAPAEPLTRLACLLKETDPYSQDTLCVRHLSPAPPFASLSTSDNPSVLTYPRPASCTESLPAPPFKRRNMSC